jgi:hypothetical protein
MGLVWTQSAGLKRTWSSSCLRSSSLLALRHVTRYLVRLRNEPSTSKVRCSLDDLCSMKLITKNPRFCIMCCWTVCDVSTSSQMKPRSFELRRERCVGESDGSIDDQLTIKWDLS